MAYETEQAIYDRLRQAPTFHPAGVSLFAPDWTLEPGDVVTVRSGEDSYRMPVYSLDLQWQGQSKVGIQSTGNQKREPLPALQRRRYAAGRASYQQEKDIEELQEQTVQYTQKFEVSDQKIASIMTATGVLLDDNYEPVIDPVTGLFVFDTTSPGATLQSRIDQNASAISLEATTRAADYTTLSGRITTEAGKISQIVTAVGKNGEVTAASIVTAINARTGTGVVKISADQIELEGTTIINLLQGGAVDVYSLSANEVIAQELIIDDGTGDGHDTSFYTTTIGNTASPQTITFLGDSSYTQASTITYADFPHYHGLSLTNGVLSVDDVEATNAQTPGNTVDLSAVVTAITLTPPPTGSNTYTLSATKLDGKTAQIGTFSRATSLNGGWSGGEYTVTATPQNEENSTALYAIAANGEPSRNSVLPKYLNVPLKVLYDDGEDGQETGFTETISVNASLIWQDGYDAGGGGVVVNPELYIGSTWDYDDGAYKLAVQIRDGASVLETDYVDLPATKVVVSQPTASWSSSNHNYTLSASGTDYLNADTGNEHSLAAGSNTSTLTPTDAINYGKTLVNVTAGFNTATVPSGATPTVLTSGEKYRLLVQKDGTTVLDQYYSVPAQTAQRTVSSISQITLTSSDTGTNAKTVTVTYSDGNTGTATVNVAAGNVYMAGQNSVTVTSASIVSAQVVYSAANRTARGPMNVTLSNGDSKTLSNVNLDAIYQEGLDGLQMTSPRTFEFELEDTNVFYNLDEFDVTIGVSDVYQKGVDDRSGGGFPKTMYVYTNNGGTLNVRQGASTSSSILGALYPKTQVTVTGEDGNYYKISFDGISGTAPSGYSYGYVEKSFMSDSSDSPTEYGIKRGWFAYIYVYATNGGTVRVRASASSSGTVIGSLYPRTAIADIGEDEDYYEIRLSGISGTPDRTGYSTGYILKSLTSTSANSPSNYGNKRGWYAAIKNGDPTGNSTYPYYGVTTATATNIYNAPNGAAIVFTAGRNSNIMCTVNPANQSSGWTPCKLNAYEGYVQLSSFH